MFACVVLLSTSGQSITCNCLHGVVLRFVWRVRFRSVRVRVVEEVPLFIVVVDSMNELRLQT